jgi:CBS domain-containing protein/ribosome-associated translation inhibitor RaiA
MASDASLIPRELISDTKVFDVKTSMSEIINAVKKYSAVVVNKNDSYYGVVDTRVVYRNNKGMKFYNKESAEKYATRTNAISGSTRINDAIYYFYKSRLTALPYVEDGKVKGVLKRSTLIKMLLSLGDMKGINVEEAMTAPVLAIDINTALSQASAVMRNRNVNRLLVMNGDRFEGIVTNFDIIDKYIVGDDRMPEMRSDKHRSADITLGSVVNRNPVTIDSAKSLEDAARIMIEKGISSVIVTKKGKPVGVITPINIIESVLAKRGTSSNNVFISGFDSSTYEYEDEIRESLISFMDKIARMKKVDPDYITLRIKKIKGRRYELHARLALKKKGMIIASESGNLLDRTVNDLLEKLKKDAIREKERILTIRKVEEEEEL